MNPEITITIKISVNEEGGVETAVEAGGSEEMILESTSQGAAGETAVIDLPPPPELEAEAVESMAMADLPPVPEIEPELERAALADQTIPDLPPVPELPQE
jgi:hypothetical protein